MAVVAFAVVAVVAADMMVHHHRRCRRHLHRHRIVVGRRLRRRRRRRLCHLALCHPGYKNCSSRFCHSKLVGTSLSEMATEIHRASGGESWLEFQISIHSTDQRKNIS